MSSLDTIVGSFSGETAWGKFTLFETLTSSYLIFIRGYQTNKDKDVHHILYDQVHPLSPTLTLTVSPFGQQATSDDQYIVQSNQQ